MTQARGQLVEQFEILLSSGVRKGLSAAMGDCMLGKPVRVNVVLRNMARPLNDNNVARK